MKLSLGTAQFGLVYGIANKQGRIAYNESKAILEYAAAQGIDTLDTAITYGGSEARLGEIGVKGWKVISKLPAVPKECRNIHSWVWESTLGSLRRVRIGRLYGLLLHRPDQLLNDFGRVLFQAMEDLKDKNIVQKIGISIYAPIELDALCQQYSFDIIQAPFNILDHRLISSGWLSRLSQKGIELHVRSVFLQGLLLLQPTERPERFNSWKTIFNCWDAWIKESGLEPLTACIQYALSFPEISKIVVGVDSLNQLKEILRITEGPMPEIPEELHCNDVNLINPARWQVQG